VQGGAEPVAIDQTRQRAAGGCQRHDGPPQPHQLEDLRGVDALRARHVVEQAERTVARGELVEHVVVRDVARALDPERLGPLERVELGLDDAPDEPQPQRARDPRAALV
jgi:hypothetical protein